MPESGQPGVIGFYRPDPGSHHSPMVALAPSSKPGYTRIFEIQTQCALLLDVRDWMGKRGFQEALTEVSSSRRYAPGGPGLLRGFVQAGLALDRIRPADIASILAEHRPEAAAAESAS